MIYKKYFVRIAFMDGPFVRKNKKETKKQETDNKSKKGSENKR